MNPFKHYFHGSILFMVLLLVFFLVLYAVPRISTSSAATQSVTSFTLINADNDLPITGFDPLLNNATLDYAALPTNNLNIRANTSPATVGNVKFILDGAAFSTESTPPYALAGDSSGDYKPWTPSTGTHSITATPYAAISSAAGTPLTITFTVINNFQPASPTPTPTPTPSSSPNPNPVGHWKFDESSGTTANDASGLNNTGTLFNGPAHVSGKLDSALQFDGTDDYVDAGSNASLDALGNLTYSAWVYPTSNGENGYGVIVKKGLGDSGTSKRFLTNKSSCPANTACLEWSVNACPAGTAKKTYIDGIEGWQMSLNAWHLVVATLSNGSGCENDSNGNLIIGSWPGRTSGTFSGAIDDVRVYNRVLSPAEIQALYASAPTPTPSTKFSMGQRVQVSVSLANVLTSPGGTVAGTQPAGELGNIAGGPVFMNNAWFWQITYDTDPQGWTTENALKPASPSGVYYPPPENSGGWRTLVGRNTTPTAQQKTDILNKTGIDWDLLKKAWDYSLTFDTQSTVLVIRKGWIAGEWGSNGGYQVMSVSKSLTSLAMGKIFDLSDEGKLSKTVGHDDFAYQYLPQSFGDSDPLKKQIRIKDLMTMSAGIKPYDGGAPVVGYNQWLTQPMQAAPETEWAYSSLSLGLLSMIIQDNIMHESVASFVNREIASPIGVSSLSWLNDGPYTGTAGGAAISARDLARVAYLTLKQGAWDNGTDQKQIITQNRISMLTQWAPFLAGTQFKVTPGSPFTASTDSPNHYGYLWWTNRTNVALGPSVPPDAYFAHGFKDNLAIVVPSMDLMVIRLAKNGPGSDPNLRKQLMSRVISAVIANP